MTSWASSKARRVLSALYRIGWTLKRQSGSHKTLCRPGWADVVFSFRDGDEVGPRMLARIAKHTGLKPEDL
jgi:predicted RNA binding protein YcfA (HicA-like mRNA interferase family)